MRKLWLKKTCLASQSRLASAVSQAFAVLRGRSVRRRQSRTSLRALLQMIQMRQSGDPEVALRQVRVAQSDQVPVYFQSKTKGVAKAKDAKDEAVRRSQIERYWRNFEDHPGCQHLRQVRVVNWDQAPMHLQSKAEGSRSGGFSQYSK